MQPMDDYSVIKQTTLATTWMNLENAAIKRRPRPQTADSIYVHRPDSTRPQKQEGGGGRGRGTDGGDSCREQGEDGGAGYQMCAHTHTHGSVRSDKGDRAGA